MKKFLKDSLLKAATAALKEMKSWRREERLECVWCSGQFNDDRDGGYLDHKPTCAYNNLKEALKEQRSGL